MTAFRKSLQHALRALRFVAKNETNFQLEIFAGFIAVLFAIYFQFSRFEWVILVGTIGAVLALECLNTSAEYLLDILKPRLTLQVQIVKDVMAAVVLIGAITATLIGCMLFFPHVIELSRTL